MKAPWSGEGMAGSSSVAALRPQTKSRELGVGRRGDGVADGGSGGQWMRREGDLADWECTSLACVPKRTVDRIVSGVGAAMKMAGHKRGTHAGLRTELPVESRRADVSRRGDVVQRVALRSGGDSVPCCALV